MHITLKQINNFIVLSETLHLTEASQKLYLTPSALHKQIKNLEEQLGNKLFKTKGKRIELTGFGESMLPQSRNMILEYDKFIRKAQISLTHDTPISINVDFAHQVSVMNKVKNFKEMHPNILIDVNVSLWEEQQSYLSNSKGTLYLSGEPLKVNKNVKNKILKNQRLSLLLEKVTLYLIKVFYYLKI
ncbi:hypothetical protein CF386_10230 [Paraphotobacterium marinum]|uniref:HTH lysR-type domain-containing protein n=1 Tax=Paraphotobacterium marinum TaxID=1755811 RepID=A0A220VG82_9GAMM|nr:LysR family transcriptional regulator [Paraphotobacterium marinum]ASK79428.1 hypothetical protein CF386_10230 [Paraphotobacterium marinum]